MAQVSISNNTSTPVATNTASNGAAADVTLESGATFTIQTDNTAALTLNSNNNLTVAGTVTSNNVQNVTGILVTGATGSVTNSGTINLTESYTASDSVNSDGITEAPYAQGYNRYGIQTTGPLAGDIINAGSITIQGNSSAGILVGSSLNGSLISSGSINLTGDNGYAIHVVGPVVGGTVQVTGAINVKGTNSVGVQTDSQIDGALGIYTTVQTTGYAYTTRETVTTALQKIEATPADLGQGGSAVVVNGSVMGGIYLAAPPVAIDPTTDTTTDNDGDGIPDSEETSAALSTYGSAPALQIGSASGPITIGNFHSTPDNYSFGLVISGTVDAEGVYDGYSATAVDIGHGNAGVNLSAGIHIMGTVTASAYTANATAFHIEAGTTGGAFWNSGVISTLVTSGSVNQSTVLQIDQGANIPVFLNDGNMIAQVTGDAANSTVVVDNSGTMNNLLNRGVITASVSPTAAGQTITGQGIAFDLRSNTSGITFTQEQLQGAGYTPAITGDILLGSGTNAVYLLNGTMTGTLNMGSGVGGILNIDNSSVYEGSLIFGGTGLNIIVGTGTLIDKSTSTIHAASLSLGSGALLTVALDPANNAATFFNVSGAATLTPGAKIGAVLQSVPSLSGQTFTIVKAGSLSTGGVTDTSLQASLPYMFNGSVHADTTANTISITVNTKSPAEMGFNKAETTAFNAIYAALPHDTGVQSTLITAPDRATLVSAYDQLLPNSSGDVFQTVFGMSKAVSRAAAERFDVNTQGEDEDEDDYVVSGFWASEFFSGIEQNKDDNVAYHSAGLGVIGGYDFGGTGFTFSASSANVVRPGQAGDSLDAISVMEAGFYAAPRFGPLMLDGRVGVGYLKITDRRQLVASVVSGDLSTTTTVTRTADASWNGYDLSGHLGAALQWDFGKHFFLQPRVYADILHTHEDGYTEKDGGDAYDYKVDQRQGTETNGTVSFVTGLKFGNSFVFSPQLELGYDKLMTGGPGDTTAQFVYGGPSFTVAANKMDGAAMARLTLRGDGNYVHFALQGGGEFANTYHTLDFKAVFRMTF